MPADASSGHLFWIASRAAGTSALVLSSAAVSVGILQGGRFLRSGSKALRPLHEALSIATLVAIAFHGLALLGDGFLAPTLAQLLVPFLGSYQPFWTSLGILSAWALVALGLTYYARGRIGVSRWRSIHRFTALAWLAAIAHSLGEGTDAGQAWFLAATALAVLPALALLALVHLVPRSARRRAEA